MPGKCHFNVQWMQREGFKLWLRPSEKNKYRAVCIICNTEFDVSHGGANSVDIHAKGKKHIGLTGPLKEGSQSNLKETFLHPVAPTNSTHSPILQPSTSQSASAPLQVANSLSAPVQVPPSSSAEPTVRTTSSTVPTLSPYLIKDEITKSEILWCLFKVMSHSSDRSCGSATDVFPLMFSDSYIAQNMKLHKDKIGYTITFGLGPFFQDELVNVLKACSFFAFSFDESLNKVCQKGQMDIIVSYWDEVGNKVVIRYLTSAFLEHAKAVDLLEGLTGAISKLKLPLKKTLQVAMDGPNVNLKALQDFRFYLKENCNDDDPEPFDTGTCSLHVIHGSLKTSQEKVGWGTKGFLQVSYYFFINYPTRRADFVKYTGSTSFPLKFCTTRWVENDTVINRATDTLKYLKIFVNKAEEEKKYLDSELFQKLKSHLEDELLPARLQFVLAITKDLEPFLHFFQANKPLFPFLYEKLLLVLRSLSVRFIKADVLAEANSGKKLAEIDVGDSKNLLYSKEVVIGEGAKFRLKGVNEKEALRFYRDCRSLLVLMFKKIVDKSPLKSKMVKGASCLSPRVMVKPRLRASRLTLALEEFMERKHISPSEADRIKRNYEALANLSMKKLEKFEHSNDRIDTFLIDLCLEFKVTDPIFLTFIKKIMVMIHGNATVERGFSVNSECLVENMHCESLVAQRHVYDKILVEGGISKIEISKKLIFAARSASAKRCEALKSKAAAEAAKKENELNIDAKIKDLVLKRKMIEQEQLSEIQQLDDELSSLRAKKLKKSYEF